LMSLVPGINTPKRGSASFTALISLSLSFIYVLLLA
jgi:hypothetical protein